MLHMLHQRYPIRSDPILDPHKVSTHQRRANYYAMPHRPILSHPMPSYRNLSHKAFAHRNRANSFLRCRATRCSTTLY